MSLNLMYIFSLAASGCFLISFTMSYQSVVFFIYFFPCGSKYLLKLSLVL